MNKQDVATAHEPEVIADDDWLYRRIHEPHVRPDGTVTRGVFYRRGNKPDPYISVDMARLTTPMETLQRGPPHGRWGVAELAARTPRAEGFTVRHQPEPENYAHAKIEGDNTKAKCTRLAEGTRVVLVPQQV